MRRIVIVGNGGSGKPTLARLTREAPHALLIRLISPRQVQAFLQGVSR